MARDCACSVVTDKTTEAAALKTQLEQLRHKFAQKQQCQSEATLHRQGLTGDKLISEDAQGQQSSSATALPVGKYTWTGRALAEELCT